KDAGNLDVVGSTLRTPILTETAQSAQTQGSSQLHGPRMGSFMSPHPAHAAVSSPEGYPLEPPAPQHFPQPILPPQPRVVWPWAAFVIGAVALVGVWYGRPYWRVNDADRVRRDLAEMRSLLARPTPDVNKAIKLGNRVLELGSSFPQYVGEAN